MIKSICFVIFFTSIIPIIRLFTSWMIIKIGKYDKEEQEYDEEEQEYDEAKMRSGR